MAVSPSDLFRQSFQGLSTQPVIVANQSTSKLTPIPTVTIPIAACRVVTTTGVQYDIRRILSFSCLNTIGYNVPKGQLKFVVEQGDVEPAIDAPDEIYIYAAHNATDIFNAGILTTAQIDFVMSSGFQDVQNRLYTGLIDRVHKIRDTQNGRYYVIEFSTFMKKFDITTEWRPQSGLASGSIPTVVQAQLSFASAGDLVSTAAQQSNVASAYIFKSVQNTTGNIYESTSPGISQDIGVQFNGNLKVDGAGIRAFNDKTFPMQTSIPGGISLTNYNYEKWDSILTTMCDLSFCELFFSKYGEMYFRQFGGFRPAGDWDISIDPEIVVSYDVSSGDDIRPITQLDVRYLPGPSGLVNGFRTYAPGNVADLESLYGRRAEQIDVPHAIFAMAKNVFDHSPFFGNNSVDAAGILAAQASMQAGQTVLQQWVDDFAQYYLALRNASIGQARIIVIGNNAFEVGQTVYLQQEDMVYYVTGVQQVLTVGDKWTTELTCMYGRPSVISFLGILNNPLRILGDRQETTDTPPETPNPVVGGLPSGVKAQLNPFASYTKYTVTNQYGPGGLGNDGPYHTGVDLVPADGSLNLIALLDSRVISVGVHGIHGGTGNFGPENDEGWGFYVCYRPTEFQDYVICYSHLNVPPSLVEGQSITRGQVIAQMGNTGNVQGSNGGTHLHFQVDSNSWHNTYKDPANKIGQTFNPWVFLDTNYSLSTVSNAVPTVPVNTTESPSGTSTTDSTSTQWTLNGKNLLDNSFQDDVKKWAALLTQGSLPVGAGSAARNFFIALSMSEVGDPNNITFGGGFAGKYNFGTVTGVNNSSNQVDQYNGIEDAASNFKTYFYSRFKELRIYLTTTLPDNFSITHAVQLLANGNYKGNVSVQFAGYQNIITAYNTLKRNGY